MKNGRIGRDFGLPLNGRGREEVTLRKWRLWSDLRELAAVTTRIVMNTSLSFSSKAKRS